MIALILGILLVVIPIGPSPVLSQEILPIDVVTVYHAVAAQTDDNPLETADGTVYSQSQVESGAIRIAALSRELLARWGGPVSYGDYIWVDVGDSEPTGLWQVHDTMDASARGYVDLLVSQDTINCWVHWSAVDRLPRHQCRISDMTVYHIGGLHAR